MANNVGSDGTQHLARSSLRELNLSENLISDKGVAYFSSNTTLNFLRLTQCNLSETGFSSVLKIRGLIPLNFFKNPLPPEAIILFPEDCRLEILDISQTKIYDDSILDIPKLRRLKSLNLESNWTSDARGLALPMIPSLETLF
jgi:Leucine-rich repeat (LRR) protein